MIDLALEITFRKEMYTSWCRLKQQEKEKEQCSEGDEDYENMHSEKEGIYKIVKQII